MAAPLSSPAYAEATPILAAHPSAEAPWRVPRRSDTWMILVRGLVTLGEAVLVVLALPFIILGMGLPVVLVVRLMLEVFRAYR